MMVGWYLDVLVGYLIRIVIQMMKARGSGTWPVEKGTVTEKKEPKALLNQYTYTQKGILPEPGLFSSWSLNRGNRPPILPRWWRHYPGEKPGKTEGFFFSEDDQTLGFGKRKKKKGPTSPSTSKTPCRASLGLDGRGARPHTSKNKSRQLSLTA